MRETKMLSYEVAEMREGKKILKLYLCRHGPSGLELLKTIPGAPEVTTPWSATPLEFRTLTDPLERAWSKKLGIPRAQEKTNVENEKQTGG